VIATTTASAILGLRVISSCRCQLDEATPTRQPSLTDEQWSADRVHEVPPTADYIHVGYAHNVPVGAPRTLTP